MTEQAAIDLRDHPSVYRRTIIVGAEERAVRRFATQNPAPGSAPSPQQQYKDLHSGDLVNADTVTRLYVTDTDNPERNKTIRVGPMMFERNIEHAFDFYSEGMKFAMPRASYPPYDRISSQHLEIVWAAAVAANMGQEVPDDQFNWMVVGQAFAVGLPDHVFYETIRANEIVLAGARTMLQKMQEPARTWLLRRSGNADWAVLNSQVEMPPEGIPMVLEANALHLSLGGRARMMEAYMGIFLAYTQQGNITVQKLDKIIKQIAEVQINVALTPANINTLWAKFGPFFNEEAAAYFFPRWADLFADRHIRFRLIFVQAANAGLTGLTLVRDMLALYPKFPWHKLAAQYPAEWQAFLKADATVGTNVYYGYTRDLGIVSVRNYVPIVYCAKQLREKVHGDQNMQRLMTISTFTVQHAPVIDNLVDDFRRHITTRIGPGDRELACQYYTQKGEAIPEGFAMDPPAPQPGAGEADMVQRLVEAMRGVPQQ
ncbi:putative nucleoprotein [Tacheng Tick Virus 4]|uniref:Putative nucleoprotein n=1 Tax=Tacheng Tick Virus 4 TaxID=1608086 RepID=A0A0B5KRA3_9VIRU|nr:putative nucleoprotein [Tacheng Tick Virus 4]AJG39056.1 putative nucleoprotein [Tacheng Tick Virus 4]